MKTLREMMDLIESAQPVDLRARAAELAIQILKNADMDDDSEQGYIRVDPNALFQFHVLMNTAKKQGVAEGSQQYHVVSKLDGNVLASYKTREEAHKNSHGNPVVSGSLETIGDRQYVREQGVAEAVDRYELKITDQWEDEDPESYGMMDEYEFDVLKNGQSIGTARANNYFADLYVDLNNGKHLKLSHQKHQSHPLMKEYERLVWGLDEQGVAEEQLEETEVDPVRRIEELFRDK